MLYKKWKIKGGRFLYSFQDFKRAVIEESDYLRKAEKKKDFSSDEYKNKKETFGVIVFESDQDLSPEIAYRFMMIIGYQNWYSRDIKVMNALIKQTYKVILL